MELNRSLTNDAARQFIPRLLRNGFSFANVWILLTCTPDSSGAMTRQQTVRLLVLRTKHVCLLVKYTIVYLRDTLGQSNFMWKSSNENGAYLKAICTADTTLRFNRSAFDATNSAFGNIAFGTLAPDGGFVFVAASSDFAVVKGRRNQCTFFFWQNKC